MGEMDFLIEQLKVEWSRSSQLYKTVKMIPQQSDNLTEKVNEVMADYRTGMNDEELTFKQSLRKTKECYVLLRLAKKLIKAVKKMDRYGREEMITLDKEEFKMYSLYFNEEQEKH